MAKVTMQECHFGALFGVARRVWGEFAVAEGAMECVFDESNYDAFPFEYFHPNGTRMAAGALVAVHGTTPAFGDAAASVCVFNTSACLEAHPVGADGKAFSCCRTTKTLQTKASVWMFPLIGFFGPYVLAQVLIRRRRAQGEAKKAARLAELKASGASAEEINVKLNEEFQERNPMKGMFQKTTPMGRIFLGVFFVVAITAIVFEAVIMPRSIQTTLTPPDRTAQLAMSSFLTPVSEIFSFLEDTMVVKVGYAIAANRHDDLNALLHIGVLGGVLSALVAFGVAFGISVWPAANEALLNPSSAPNDALIAGGCELVPTTDQLVDHARAYWLLIAGAWLPNFSTLSIFGFLAGTGQIIPQLLSLAVQATLPITIWFTLLKTPLQPLTSLGLTYGVPDWCLALAFLGYFIANKSLREKYGLRLQLPCSRSFRESGMARKWGAILRSVTQDGLEVMLVDLAVQLSITATIYIAASEHMETAYQLAATQAAYWSFGPSYMVGTFMILKMIGARLIASNREKAFAGMFAYTVFMTLCVSIAAIVAAIMRGSEVADDFGESACIFASSEGCAPTFASIFKGKDSLSRVFDAFGPTVGLNMFFSIMRTGLAACHDFDYMWKGSVLSLVVAYTPAIILARFVLKTGTSYYIAMYLPHFLMIAVFGARMYGHIGKMMRGEPGPWSEHKRRESTIVGISEKTALTASLLEHAGEDDEGRVAMA